jgi:hypothetical protein
MNTIRRFFHRLRSHFQSRSTAQGMVEFALALPILLLLVFGIIEFGRLLQAWLALQNGARFAVRFAVTGAYDNQYCTQAGTVLGLTSEDLLDGTIDCKVPYRYVSGVNAGQIVPNAEDETNALQDWARLPSIRDSAMAGSTGIALDPSTSISGDYPNYMANAYATAAISQDYRGDPSHPGYFGFSTCSNRVLDDNSQYMWNPTVPLYHTPPSGNLNNDRYPDYCQLTDTSGNPVRYIDDAGGPGDRVRVILTYRHTLITPFLSSWWPTLRLTAQREGIVEKFRNSAVVGLSAAIANVATYTPTPTVTDTITLTPTKTVTTTPTTTLTPATCSGTGGILWERFDNITGSAVSNLTSAPNYPNYPDAHSNQPNFDGPRNFADNYGGHFRGWLCPPYTGQYQFWIASDNQGEFYISTDNTPAHMSKVSYLSSGSASYLNWADTDIHPSGLINLVGGQQYYVEALFKEGTGSDNVSVGWTGPTFPSTTLIIGQYLIPYPYTALPTRTATITSTPTPTLTPDCGSLQLQSPGEDLSIEDLASYPGKTLQTWLKNTSLYNVTLTGATMAYNNGWHDGRNTAPLQTFDKYSKLTSHTLIYDAANTSTYPFSHTISSNNVIAPNTTFWFNWDYAAPPNFYDNPPYFRSYPTPGAGTATPSFNPGPSEFQSYFWTSDYTGTINYTVGSRTCSITVTGDLGPQPVISFNPTTQPFNGSPFQINVATNFNGLTPDYTYIYVYDSTGALVSYNYFTGNKASTACLFANNSGTCAPHSPYIDYWRWGPSADSSTKIVTGNYTVVVLARGETVTIDYATRKKSAVVIGNFRIVASTPTATTVPTITRTPTSTPVPPTLTITKTPTKTFTSAPPTLTLTRTDTPVPPTPTITKTPTKTFTPAPPTNTPTKTPTRTKTATQPPCLTPADFGGCPSPTP